MKYGLLLLLLLVLIIIYLAGSFISWNFNPGVWNVGTRSGCAVLCLVLIYCAISYEDDDTDL